MSDELVRRGTNLIRVGDFNQTVIVDLIRRSADGVSRVELAHATSLSAQTVSNITRRLLDSELVVEAGRLSGNQGKPRTLLRIKPDGHFALGVHIDPAVVTVVLLNFVGEVVEREKLVAAELSSPQGAVAAIARSIDRLVSQAELDRSKILGVGLAVPGPVDMPRGSVVNPPHLAGWQDAEIRSMVEVAANLPVSMQKDVVAAAIGESWVRGEPRDQSFGFVYLGTGVGTGLVLNGEVIAGHSGNAGEIGHIIVDSDGPMCWCGSRGCFGVSCMAAALVAEAVAAGVVDGAVTADPPTLDVMFAEFATSVLSGRGDAVAIAHRAAERFARAALDLANLLDLTTVVFGGRYWELLESVYTPVVQGVIAASRTKRDGHEIRILSSAAGADVAAVGAGCLVLDEVFSPRPTSLPFGV